MQAGLVTEVCEVWRRTYSRNEFGEEIEDYEYLKTIKCGLERDNKASRAVEDPKLVYNDNKTIIVRIHTDIQETDHIKMNGKTYRIININTERKYMRETIDIEKIDE